MSAGRAAPWTLSGALTVTIALLPCAAAPAAAQQPAAMPAFRPLRYDEDWRVLADPARRADPLDALKYVRLGAGTDAYLSLGGELRERYELQRNDSFGVSSGPRRDGYLLQRFLLHTDLHLGPNLRVFTQLSDTRAFGAHENLGAVQENRTDLAQAFADLSFATGAGRATLRGGRQEMSFGSERLVSQRESPNVRRAFDGARASLSPGPGLRFDAFAVRPVANRQGAVDSSNRAEAFWGAYGTAAVPGVEGLLADLYYFGRERERAAFQQGTAFDQRHTVGARLFGRGAGGWDWDFEGAYQFGSFGRASIRAWTAASDTGLTLSRLPWSPRIGLKADIASGDRNPQDDTLETFDPLYPKAPYFTEAGLVAPANLINLFPSVRVRPAEAVTVELGWDVLWRHRRGDAFYRLGPFAPLPGSAGGRSRFVGHQAQLTVTWQASRRIAVRAWYVHFFAGDTIERAGGRDMDFVGASVSWKF